MKRLALALLMLSGCSERPAYVACFIADHSVFAGMTKGGVHRGLIGKSLEDISGTTISLDSDAVCMERTAEPAHEKLTAGDERVSPVDGKTYRWDGRDWWTTK